MSNLARDVRQVTAGIDPARTSTTKWNPLRDVLAEALHEAPRDIYPTTVSKAGNIPVRFRQSDRAGAPIVVAVYTGPGSNDLANTINQAKARAAGRRLVLF